MGSLLGDRKNAASFFVCWKSGRLNFSLSQNTPGVNTPLLIHARLHLLYMLVYRITLGSHCTNRWRRKKRSYRFRSSRTSGTRRPRPNAPGRRHWVPMPRDGDGDSVLSRAPSFGWDIKTLDPEYKTRRHFQAFFKGKNIVLYSDQYGIYIYLFIYSPLARSPLGASPAGPSAPPPAAPPPLLLLLLQPWPRCPPRWPAGSGASPWGCRRA